MPEPDCPWSQLVSHGARGRVTDATTVRDLDQFREAAHNGVTFTVVKIEPWIVEVPTRYYHFLEERNRFVRYVERTENISVLRPVQNSEKRSF